MKEQEEKCRLCGNTAPLCRSHIVPDFAYRPIKNDEKGHILAVGRKVRKVQTGYFERLLCSKCEGILSRYETSFKRLWMDTIPPDFTSIVPDSSSDPVVVDVPDFDTFKLFHLSVLWRAAVSDGFKIDPGISLGRYEKVLADMIYKGNPGKPGDFPILAHLIVGKKKLPVPTVAPLAKGSGRLDGRHHYYMMTYAFCDWVFIIAQPASQRFIDLEKRFRHDRVFWLLPVPFSQTKSTALWAKLLGDLRDQG